MNVLVVTNTYSKLEVPSFGILVYKQGESLRREGIDDILRDRKERGLATKLWFW